jgi:hypothetical protein
VALVVLYGVVAVGLVSVEYIALVPGHSIPYLWNVFTASWLETNVGALAVSCVTLLAAGEEPCVDGPGCRVQVLGGRV